jgi:phosphate starvation-inducible PhoH-like protein
MNESEMLYTNETAESESNSEHISSSENTTEFVDFDSMDEAIKLFGVFDENLHIIEAETGAHISFDSEQIKVSGEHSAVAAASGVIAGMLALIRKGESIDRGRIRYAIDLAREGSPELILDLADDVIAFTSRGKQIKCKTLGQKKYVKALKRNTVVFGVGPAGTGKTYLAVAMAVLAFKNKEVSRIILTRPAVEAGEKLGFLPGDLQNKVDPYLRPLYDALYDFLGSEGFKTLSERGVIEVAPLAYMRGRTLNDAYIILDEAQNCTIEQMKMFLTRFGEGSRVVVTGDITQIDLPAEKKSGLIHALRVLADVEGISTVHLTARDVVRHEMVQRIVRAYEKAAEASAARRAEQENGGNPTKN